MSDTAQILGLTDQCLPKYLPVYLEHTEHVRSPKDASACPSNSPDLDWADRGIGLVRARISVIRYIVPCTGMAHIAGMEQRSRCVRQGPIPGLI